MGSSITDNELIIKYEQEAQAGNSEFQFKLAQLYDKKLNYKKSAYWYRQAANQNHSEAQLALAQLYATGQGLKQNFQKSAYWYKKAASLGQSLAQLELAKLYESGLGVALNLKKAFVYYQDAAQANLSEAQFKLALCYEKGIGTIINLDKAKALYSKASAQGCKVSAEHLAALQAQESTQKQIQEQIVPQSTKQEEEKLSHEAQDLFMQAQSYELGLQGKADLHLAYEYYLKAAKANHGEACFNLAKMYSLGLGVNLDYEICLALLFKSISCGNMMSYNCLCFILESYQQTQIKPNVIDNNFTIKTEISEQKVLNNDTLSNNVVIATQEKVLVAPKGKLTKLIESIKALFKVK